MFFSTFNFMLGHEMISINSKLSRGTSTPNSRLGHVAPAPNPLLGQGRERTHLHVGLWCVHPWLFFGTDTSWTQFLLGSACELNLMSLRLSAQLKDHFT
jgi:hypothetical protein